MITHKYNYEGLKRESLDGKRHYVLPNGSKVASVTTILDKTKPDHKKQALFDWRKRVGDAKATEITTEAAGVGTRMHTFLENYIKTGELKQPGSNPYSKQGHDMARTIIDNSFKYVNEFWGMEANLFYSELYAGTTDLVGVWNGKPAIIDFKQTNKPKKTEWIEDYFLQLTAYSSAHDSMFNTEIECGVILMCSRDLKFQCWVIEGDEFKDWRAKWWDRVEAYYSQN